VSSYNRPSIDTPVFRDADGQVIDYGNRWSGSPPENTYSVDTHPERFAPIHAVADALIAHLGDTYDVHIDEGEEMAADLRHPAYHDVVRAVRIRPNDPACASLTLVFTAYPGIYMHAGLLNDFHYPVCGCDACDSTWQTEADELERHVLAVVAGHYREIVERRESDPWVGYAFTYPDGASSGGSREQGMSIERFTAAESVLRQVSDGWSEWPRVDSSSFEAVVKGERFRISERTQPGGAMSYDFAWLNGPADGSYGFTVGRSAATPKDLVAEARGFVESFYGPGGIGETDFPDHTPSDPERAGRNFDSPS